ncbi:linear amide C-N hydrolase [Vibrio cholerae]|nr:linear amide C-N hydrolase [Vibrio cholerae]EJL6644614.1 linear amide C-N hydrolase [Vibrio cholerae]
MKMKHMKPYTTMKTVLSTLAIALAFGPLHNAQACTRILYETGNQSYISGRSMDWADPSAATALWVFPKGMKRDGTVGDNPIKWSTKYGSIIVSFYDAGTADGMNEKGLVANMLYLKEAKWGDASKAGKPTLTAGAWAQYFLDNYATVKEAVTAMANPPFTIIAPSLPNGDAAALHLSISDVNGDSAIFEYIDGKLVIHHGSQYKVMTNSPTFDQQLALNTYWQQIGGSKFLPGTINAADRFVRASYALSASPKYRDNDLALASVFSQIRAVSVPLGITDPDRPNLAMTLWRTFADHTAKIYYFESAVFPAVSWLDMSKVDLTEGAAPKVVRVERGQPLAGELSTALKPAEPFKWLGAE